MVAFVQNLNHIIARGFTYRSRKIKRDNIIKIAVKKRNHRRDKNCMSHIAYTNSHNLDIKKIAIFINELASIIAMNNKVLKLRTSKDFSKERAICIFIIYFLINRLEI